MSKIVFLFFAAVFLVGCGAKEGDFQNLTAEQAREMMTNTPDLQVVDVRTPAECSAGILPNALQMDIYSTDFADRVKQLDPKKPVLLYCASGARSAKAARMLKDMGFGEVSHLQGGFRAWKTAGYQTVAP